MKKTSFIFIASAVFLFFAVQSVLALTPVFTNNNAPKANFTTSSTDNVVLDITLPAPDTDTFLDGDGASSASVGERAAITAGDVLVKLVLASGVLCGDTDGTTIPSNIVHDSDGDCGQNSIETVDTGGVLSKLGNSIVLDSNDYPVVAYYDATNGDLKILHCNDVNCAGGDESIIAVDTAGDVGAYNSLILDGSGYPVVAYHDETNDYLKILHCNDVNCAGGDESIASVDFVGIISVYTRFSIQLDVSGNPVVSYQYGTGKDLRILHCGNANCTSGNSIETVDNGEVGEWGTSLALDGDDYPIVSYYDGSLGGSGSSLKILHCNDVNCAGGDESIVIADNTADGGPHSSLVLDSSGNPVVSYYDDSPNRNLKLMHCRDADCSGNKSIVTVDSSADVGPYTSLKLDASGYPVVSYRDSTNTSLKVLHCNDADCSGGDESIITVDSSGNVGRYGSLALDGNYYPVVSYEYEVGPTSRNLKVLHCDNVNCASGTRGVVLGTDTNATNDLSATNSLIVFKDNSSNSTWESGEDLYFDADDSLLYNAGTLDAITVRNSGTAVDTTDISLLKLWVDDGDASFSSSLDTNLDADCIWDGVDDWECDVNYQFTSALRLFVSADIATSARIGRTIQMQVAELVDDGATTGAFDSGDTGIFFSNNGVANTGNHDGPASAITNTAVQTIISSSSPQASDTTFPGPVTDFTATDATTGGSIILLWTNPSDEDFAQVHIYRATTGSDFTLSDTNKLISTTSISNATQTYTDTGLTDGQIYYYKIRTQDTNSNLQTGLFYPTASATPTAPETVEGATNVTPEEGGEVTIITDEEGTITVEVPPDAVETTTTVTVSSVAISQIQEQISALPSSKTIVGHSVFDVTAVAEGISVKNFAQPLTLIFTYKDAQVVGLDETTLEIHFYNETTQMWEALPSTVDIENNTVTAITTHLTRFAIVAAADVTPPLAPTNISVIEASPGTTTLSWTNPTNDFRHSKIYRSLVSGTLGALIANDITVSVYSDLIIKAGTLYYYTVRAVDPAGNESTNTQQVSVLSSGTGIVDGDLITTADSFDIYIVKLVGDKKFKRLILNPQIFESYGHLEWGNVKTVSQIAQDSFTLSELAIEVNEDGSVADPKVYKVSSAPNSDVGQRSWLNMTAAQFEQQGYDWDAIYKINHTEASPDFYPTGDPITAS